MKILFVTDTHDFLDSQCVNDCLDECVPDCIIGLGDVSLRDYRTLQNIESLANVPKGGILGNHDSVHSFEYFSRSGIRVSNLDKKPFTLQGISFLGISGALKYKDLSEYAFLSHDESLKIMAEMPAVDVLLSHDQPYFGSRINGMNYIDPHEGLAGLAEYTREKHPQIHIHGHLHWQYDKINDGNCREICLYQYALIELKKENDMVICDIIRQTSNDCVD